MFYAITFFFFAIFSQKAFCLESMNQVITSQPVMPIITITPVLSHNVDIKSVGNHRRNALKNLEKKKKLILMMLKKKNGKLIFESLIQDLSIDTLLFIAMAQGKMLEAPWVLLALAIKKSKTSGTFARAPINQQ